MVEGVVVNVDRPRGGPRLGDMGFIFGLVPSRMQGDDAMQLLNAKLDNRAFELQPAAR